MYTRLSVMLRRNRVGHEGEIVVSRYLVPGGQDSFKIIIIARCCCCYYYYYYYYYERRSQNCAKRLLASSCLSVRMEQLGSRWKDFQKKNCIDNFTFVHLSKKFKSH